MKELLNEPENITISYVELQCILGAYFRPIVLEHESWLQIAEEIVNYYTPMCVKKIIRQIDILLANQAIDDRRLTIWVVRYATTWTSTKDSDAREYLNHLRANLVIAAKQRQRTPLLAPLSNTSFA